MTTAAKRFAALPTAAKLLLILGCAASDRPRRWCGSPGPASSRPIDGPRAGRRPRASRGPRHRKPGRAQCAGPADRRQWRLRRRPDGACDRAQRSLAVAPAVAQRFALEHPRRQAAVRHRRGRRARRRHPDRARRHRFARRPDGRFADPPGRRDRRHRDRRDPGRPSCAAPRWKAIGRSVRSSSATAGASCG